MVKKNINTEYYNIYNKDKKENLEQVPKDTEWPPLGGPDPENPWTCALGNFFDINDDGVPEIIEDDVKDGIKKYKKVRDGNGTTKQQNVIKKLLEGNYCVVGEDTPQMTGQGGNGDEGFELNCYNAFGKKVPNCACDRNCFPNTFGCYDPEKKTSVPCAAALPEPKEHEQNPVPAGDNPNDCTQPNVANAMESITDMAQAMGMDQVCKTTAEVSQANGSMHANINMGPFLNGNAGAQFASSSMSNSSQGCAQRLLNVTRNMTNIQNIQCQINKAKARGSVITSQNARINVRISESENLRELFRRMASDANQNLRDFNIISQGLSPRLQSQLLDTFRQAHSVAVNLQQTTISNNTFTARNNLKIVNVISASAQSAQDVISEQIQNLEQAVKNELESKQGVGALGPNVNQTINNEAQNQLTNITQAIMNVQAEASTRTDNNAVIDVVVPLGTNLDNNIFDAGNETNITQEAITTAVQQMGVSIANKLQLAAATAISNKTTSEGLDELVAQMGKANIGFAETGNWVGNVAMGQWLVIGAAILGFFIVVGIIGYVLFSGGSDSTAAALAGEYTKSQKPF
jgi:hypothetical protein